MIFVLKLKFYVFLALRRLILVECLGVPSSALRGVNDLKKKKKSQMEPVITPL